MVFIGLGNTETLTVAKKNEVRMGKVITVLLYKPGVFCQT